MFYNEIIMYLIEAIPLNKIPLSGPQILTYFSKQKLKRGSLISVPLAKGKIKAIVYHSSNILDKKTEIKDSKFSLKPIDRILSKEPIITSQQLELARYIHNQYLTPLGPVLKIFIPDSLIKRKKEFNQIISKKEYSVKKISKKPIPILLWKKDRTDIYLKEIKKTIKEKRNILFLVPEIYKINIYLEKLKKIDSSVQIFSNQLKISEELEIWKKVKNNEIRIIIGTRSCLFLPFQDIGLIIVDEEENPSYKSWDQHPKYNAKDIALQLSEQFKSKIILGTSLPSINSFYLSQKKIYQLQKELSKKRKEIKIIDMKNERKWGNFSIFTEKLKKEMEKSLENKESILLFINRKGLATTIFCKDCGYLLKCDNCDAPLVFHRSKKDKLICHHCGSEKKPTTICPQCGSLKVKYSGLGTQKVNEQFTNFFKFLYPEKEPKIQILESEVPDEKEEEIIKEFKKNDLDVLITTQVILKYPEIKSKLTGIILSDHILNFPDYKSTENFIQILFKLKSLSKKTIIQTYKKESNIFQYLENENFEEFFNKELKQRKKFFYPPFSEIAKLTYSNKSKFIGEEKVRKTEKIIKKIFPEKQILGPAPAFIPRIKNQYIWNIILKIKEKDKETLKGIIQNFPVNWEIDINPENLL